MKKNLSRWTDTQKKRLAVLLSVAMVATSCSSIAYAQQGDDPMVIDLQEQGTEAESSTDGLDDSQSSNDQNDSSNTKDEYISDESSDGSITEEGAANGTSSIEENEGEDIEDEDEDAEGGDDDLTPPEEGEDTQMAGSMGKGPGTLSATTSYASGSGTSMSSASYDEYNRIRVALPEEIVNHLNAGEWTYAGTRNTGDGVVVEDHMSDVTPHLIVSPGKSINRGTDTEVSFEVLFDENGTEHMVKVTTSFVGDQKGPVISGGDNGYGIAEWVSETYAFSASGKTLVFDVTDDSTLSTGVDTSSVEVKVNGDWKKVSEVNGKYEYEFNTTGTYYIEKIKAKDNAGVVGEESVEKVLRINTDEPDVSKGSLSLSINGQDYQSGSKSYYKDSANTIFTGSFQSKDKIEKIDINGVAVTPTATLQGSGVSTEWHYSFKVALNSKIQAIIYTATASIGSKSTTIASFDTTGIEQDNSEPECNVYVTISDSNSSYNEYTDYYIHNGKPSLANVPTDTLQTATWKFEFDELKTGGSPLYQLKYQLFNVEDGSVQPESTVNINQSDNSAKIIVNQTGTFYIVLQTLTDVAGNVYDFEASSQRTDIVIETNPNGSRAGLWIGGEDKSALFNMTGSKRLFTNADEVSVEASVYPILWYQQKNANISFSITSTDGKEIVPGSYFWWKLTFAPSETLKKQDEYLLKMTCDKQNLNLNHELTLIIDRTSPMGSFDYKPEFEDGSYVKGPVTVTGIIEEKYLKEATIASSVTRTLGKAQDETITIKGEDTSFIGAGGNYEIPVTLSEDGDYVLTLDAVDEAGNVMDQKTSKKFTIDKTAPKVTITFDNNDAVNDNYYNSGRTATIIVEDLNFDAAKTTVDIGAQGGTATESDWTAVESNRYRKTVTFNQDGRYDLAVVAYDLAGNESKKETEPTFIIDTTMPEITVTFDNNDVANGMYYKNARTATVRIHDWTLDESSIRVEAVQQEGLDTLPSLVKVSASDDDYIATMSFSGDGTYGFTVSCRDLAGNGSNSVDIPVFVIDTTVPVLAFGGVENYSANNGTVAPAVAMNDLHLDDAATAIILRGANRGIVSHAVSTSSMENGKQLQFADFERAKAMDDLYVLEASVKDLAGNETTGTLTFSVNRFGSVFVISEQTKLMMEDYYTNDPAEVSVTEINVDELTKKELTLSRDGQVKTLKERSDYRVRAQGDNTSWKSYTYTLKENALKRDGIYSLVIYTEDRATNRQDNKIKNAEVEFAVDRTAPSILVADIENKGVYEENAHDVTVDVTDNMRVTDLEVYSGEELLTSFNEEELNLAQGRQMIQIPSREDYQDIRFIATDVAGNQTQKVYRNVIVSPKSEKVIEEVPVPTARSYGEEEPTTPVQAKMAVSLMGLLALAVAMVLLERYRRHKQAQER